MLVLLGEGCIFEKKLYMLYIVHSLKNCTLFSVHYLNISVRGLKVTVVMGHLTSSTEIIALFLTYRHFSSLHLTSTKKYVHYTLYMLYTMKTVH